jgi:hypothetical protein
MGPLSRLSWWVRAVIFLVLMLALGLALDFSAPFWIGAGAGALTGVVQWRRERSETEAVGKDF